MILTVSHVTHYRYGTPVRGVVQSHRLQPSIFDGQRTIDWTVSVSDGVAGGGFRDGAGDWVQSYSVRGPVEDITVTVAGTVETFDLSGLLRGHRESTPPEAYLRDTAPTRADLALTELGRASVHDIADPLDTAHRLAGAVADAIAYRPGVTQAHTTAAEALALGEGVCQDHAHALIAAARSQLIPARYVSGYLMASGEAEQAQAQSGQKQSQKQSAKAAKALIPHEAAHAWAELWIPGLGWIGFDPANRCCPDARYIRLGSGYDARDAAPIRGTARGAGAETLDVTVAIHSVQQ